MEQSSVVTARPTEIADSRIKHEAYASGVSWPAIIAGAFVTAALWLILLALGAGIGLSAVSPWARMGASAAAVGILGIFWLIIVQVIASAMGGYLVSGAGAFCSEDKKQEAVDFFNAHPVPASRQYLQRAKDAIDDCIELRSNQGPKLQQWIAGQ